MALQGPDSAAVARLRADDKQFRRVLRLEPLLRRRRAPEPKPKRQRKTPREVPPAAVSNVGIASQGVVGTQAAVGTTGQTTRSSRQVKLTEKATVARKM